MLIYKSEPVVTGAADLASKEPFLAVQPRLVAYWACYHKRLPSLAPTRYTSDNFFSGRARLALKSGNQTRE